MGCTKVVAPRLDAPKWLHLDWLHQNGCTSNGCTNLVAPLMQLFEIHPLVIHALGTVVNVLGTVVHVVETVINAGDSSSCTRDSI